MDLQQKCLKGHLMPLTPRNSECLHSSKYASISLKIQPLFSVMLYREATQEITVV